MPIKFEQVSHIYSDGTPFRYVALEDVNLEFREGAFTAIIGQTGSGKSTLIQHLNALLLPSSGTVFIADREIKAGSEPKGLKSLRKEVGLVFQFPEYQLFEETVLKDVAFGPKNFGATQAEAEQKARKALQMVGLGKEYEERSPLELSGGQKRRVAIAGILAMDPSILVLDEPTAGLDPQGASAMMKLFRDLNKNHNKTVLMVTHDMEQVFAYCDEVVVMENGKPLIHTTVEEFFRDSEQCRKLNILPPAIIRLRDALKEKGFVLDDEARTLPTLARAIAKQVKHHG
ncbi:MAG: energy-coupling factor transporter ATPase [Solobacterium sp.]|nr:energy-coupling factor transporter ATPase [Solobacterium sp.]